LKSVIRSPFKIVVVYGAVVEPLVELSTHRLASAVVAGPAQSLVMPPAAFTLAPDTVKMGTVMPATTAMAPSIFRQFRNIIHPRSRRAW
jgi:hypothetical protein